MITGRNVEGVEAEALLAYILLIKTSSIIYLLDFLSLCHFIVGGGLDSFSYFPLKQFL